MRILTVVRKYYYGSPNAIEPMYLYFTAPLKGMGHEVDTFDHFEMSSRLGRERATKALADRIKIGQFDLVFYQTSGREPVETTALADLSRKHCIAAWNSDDDWQWGTTRRIAGHFTFMITTYPHVHEHNHSQYSNLLLSQWGCSGLFVGHGIAKDIDFSFAGSIYGERNKACRYLQHNAGLVSFGRGARLVRLGMPYFRGAFKFPWLAGNPLEMQGVYDVWNRSRISYTPLESSQGSKFLQVKGRIFEMGLSRTLVLCENTSLLDRYYEPGREVVTFDNLEDCAQKALWYLSHDAELVRIVSNYHDRTLREHMWEQRFVDLFRQMGIGDHARLRYPHKETIRI